MHPGAPVRTRTKGPPSPMHAGTDEAVGAGDGTAPTAAAVRRRGAWRLACDASARTPRYPSLQHAWPCTLQQAAHRMAALSMRQCMECDGVLPCAARARPGRAGRPSSRPRASASPSKRLLALLAVAAGALGRFSQHVPARHVRRVLRVLRELQALRAQLIAAPFLLPPFPAFPRTSVKRVHRHGSSGLSPACT